MRCSGASRRSSATSHVTGVEVFFLCHEYQAFATVGEGEPSGDEKFLSLSPHAKCGLRFAP